MSSGSRDSDSNIFPFQPPLALGEHLRKMRMFIVFLLLLPLASLVRCTYEVFNISSVRGFRKGECRAWEEFKKTYQKTYRTPNEDRFRRLVFIANLRSITAHNEKFINSTETSHNCTVNAFADLTTEEFAEQYLGFKNQTGMSSRSFSSIFRGNNKTIVRMQSQQAVVDKVDWRRTAVTSVKRQGDCGSCWAFSAAGALEGQIFLKTQKLIDVSVQSFVDCVRSDESIGCGGGSMTDIFQYTVENGVIEDRLYPYGATETWSGCQKKKQRYPVSIEGFVELTNGSESELEIAVATVGPIAVAIDGSWTSLQFYQYGVYFESRCNASNLNHAVLGFGTDTTLNPPLDYWLVKNSWGAPWGEHGYIRIARNRDNHCGIASLPSFPLVKKL